MKIFFTIFLTLLSFQFAYGQKNTYREVIKLYRQDQHLFAGTVYGIFMLPVGSYRVNPQDRGWGIGVENKISFLRINSAFTPIYNINTTINRWSRNSSEGIDIFLSGQAGINYYFPTMNETFRTYAQALIGIGAAGSYLLQNNGFTEAINHQGLGPVAAIGTGIYYQRLNLGLSYNFFNVTLKNETKVNKNMNTLQIRVGARL